MVTSIEQGTELYQMILDKATKEGITTYDIRGANNPFPVTYSAIYQMKTKGIIGPKLIKFINDYLGIEVNKVTTYQMK